MAFPENLKATGSNPARRPMFCNAYFLQPLFLRLNVVAILVAL